MASSFHISDTKTPVVVLHCGLGALSIMRTLGYDGVAVYGVTDSLGEYALKSRYCAGHYFHSFAPEEHESLRDFLCGIADELDSKPILLAASDETAIFVADHYGVLSGKFLIGQNGCELIRQLADKRMMFEVAAEQQVPSPKTYLPESHDDALTSAREIGFPIMLKGVMGNKLYKRVGKKMMVVHDEQEFSSEYNLMEDPEDRNLMVQELIPGDDDQVYIFNGYFNKNSDCLVGYTGRKIRQYPVHVGCASLGECCDEPYLYELTTSFMKRIGYRGILDIGYRKDPRDGLFKVLDINPRVGQAFRIFVSENDMDSVKALYLDLTGQELPEDNAQRNGRRWVIEDFDLISFAHYRQEGVLTLFGWIRSFRGVQEGAWFAWRDPLPFLLMTGSLLCKTLVWMGKKLPGRSEAT